MPMNKYIEEYIEARKRELTKKESNEKEKLIKKLFKDKGEKKEFKDQSEKSTKLVKKSSKRKTPKNTVVIIPYMTTNNKNGIAEV